MNDRLHAERTADKNSDQLRCIHTSGRGPHSLHRTVPTPRTAITFSVTVVLVLTAVSGFDELVNWAAGSELPLAAVGYVNDTAGNPIGGATLTLTVLNTDDSVRAVRYAVSEVDGRYQIDSDFNTTDWDLGNKLEVVAYYGSDYGSNYTFLTEENVTTARIAKVDITYPLKHILPHPGTNTAPIPIFTITPSAGTQRTLFVFDASSSYDNENSSEELQVRWDFENDGTWDVSWTFEKTTLWQYSTPGSYTARLGIRDGAGAVNTTTGTVEVTSSAPTAAFTLSVNQSEVSVNASTSSDPEGTIESYDWDFGDGSLASGITAVHRYATAGTFVIILTVMNDFGLTDTDSRNAEIITIFTLELYKGWNFVTVPTLGGGYNASNLPGLQTGDTISQWDPATQTYNRTYIKGITPPTGDFAILPSAGYWINVGAARTVNLTLGSIPSEAQTRIITIPGTSGWVNLAFNTLNATWKASSIVGMYSPGTVQSLSWYNPISKTYKTYIRNVPPSDFTLVPGQAVWVSVNGGGTFTYVP